jgi:AraC-like DNA-binding protein
MLIDNTLLYEKAYSIQIGNAFEELYYFFDYDERFYAINMDFQHFHNFYEILILLDDSGNHIIEGKLYPLKKFDMVCLRPCILHKSEYHPGPATKRLVIQFKLPFYHPVLGAELKEILKIFDTSTPIYRFDSNHQKILLEMLNEIYAHSKSESSTQTLMIHNKFIAFLSMLYHFKKHSSYTADAIHPSTSKTYAIAAYIHNHYQEELSLEILAKKFYLSTYYLSRQFKEVTGFSLINYIQMTRVRNAQQMLLFTDYKITDIALSCGFTSFSQFNRVFNKFCNMSPSKFKTHSDKVTTIEKGVVSTL